MSKGDIALIRPEMLKWARESAGMSLEIAAQRMRLPVGKVKSWEEGNSAPTINQAHHLAEIYHQPFAVFYLPKPPRKKYLKVKDYRRLPKAKSGIVSSELTLEIRRANERREIALELLEEQQQTPPLFNLRTEVTANPQSLGELIRSKLEIEFAKQSTWRNPDKAFARWKARIEELGILVFQTSSRNLAVKEARGFSISEATLPVIVVNRKDAPQAKIFTMLHELTHIMLRNSGLCDPVALYQRTSQAGDAIEVFCNRVAAETLIPQKFFLAEDLVTRIKQGGSWGDKDVVEVARKYNTSYEAILRRLLTFKLISVDFFRKKRADRRAANAIRPKSRGGPVPPVVRALNTNGIPLTRLVINAYYSRHITAHDLANYLDVKVSQVKQVAERVGIG
uniref:ImmA/IrrE family metallo-endopeptidase n=1 Tax=Oscillatoriales cyanobacterium SpSt-402 TaxID=2282168 RepID=A0A832H1D5_9CYAN